MNLLIDHLNYKYNHIKKCRKLRKKKKNAKKKKFDLPAPKRPRRIGQRRMVSAPNRLSAEWSRRRIVSAPNGLGAESSQRRNVSAPNRLSAESAAPKRPCQKVVDPSLFPRANNSNMGTWVIRRIDITWYTVTVTV